MVPTRRRESRGDRARGEPANVEEYHPARERVNQGRVPSVPPRHDVEGEIYGRLYGAAGEHGDAPRRVLGRHDPALVAPIHEDRGEPPPGRLQYAANAVRARARTWLATGAVSETAAQRRGGVVAPAPSVARALALVAVGIALVAVAALGAFIPDRATERPRAGGPSPSERAAAGPPPAARLAEADRRERAQSRRARRERQARRERRAERAHAAGRSPAHAGSGG